MLTDTFDRLFGHLAGAFLRYQDVPRTPDTIAELGASRWSLELARKNVAVERARITARRSLPVVALRQTAMSDDDLARLRVLGDGFTGR